MKVPYVDLGSQWLAIKDRAIPKISEILESGMYLEHPIIEAVENRIAKRLGVKYATTVNSGTDALIFSLAALGISKGDEVITVPNSYVASVAAIEHVGATTVFVDIGDDHLMNTDLIEGLITKRTKAIMPVHLEGKMVDITSVYLIAKKYGLLVIEDAAQAFGSKFMNYQPGNLSDVACFSFHPLKNLNAAGDGGIIATNNYELIEKIKRIKNHGQVSRNIHDSFGFVSRLDSIQAAILDLKLDDLEHVMSERINNARNLDTFLDLSKVKIPITRQGTFHTYHLYVIEIENRDYVQKKLSEQGIETKIHYPTLISDQNAYKNKHPGADWNIPKAKNQVTKILSLPVHQHLTKNQLSFTAESINTLL